MASLQTLNSVLFEVREACKLLSLAPPTGVYDSQDETAIVMGAVVNLAGTMINGAHNWQNMRNLFTVTGDGVENVFPINTGPSPYRDIDHFIDNCGWDRTSRMPVYIVDEQQWNGTKDFGFVSIYPCCRLLGSALYFLTPPPAGHTITFEYVRSGWVIDADDSAVVKTYADKNGDVPYFDWLLMVHAIRMKWLELKAMDNSGPMNDFTERFRQLTRNDVMANTLYLNGGWNNGYRYIDGVYNVPASGFGS